MKTLCFIVSLSLSTAAVAANNANQSSKANREPGATSTTAASSSSGSISDKDKAFVEKAAKAGMEEVAIAQAVQPQLSNPEAKAFAEMMVSDHSGANQELEKLATEKGIRLPLQPTGPASWDKSKRDAEYMDKMVRDHEEAVQLFTDASKNASDPDLRAFAAKTLPTLQAHLEKAKSVRKTVK